MCFVCVGLCDVCTCGCGLFGLCVWVGLCVCTYVRCSPCAFSVCVGLSVMCVRV